MFNALKNNSICPARSPEPVNLPLYDCLAPRCSPTTPAPAQWHSCLLCVPSPWNFRDVTGGEGGGGEGGKQGDGEVQDCLFVVGAWPK